MNGVVVGFEQVEDDFGELLKLHSQTQFARRYEVENSTLTKWNKIIEGTGMLSGTRKFASKLTSNVLLSLYRNIMETGDPRAVSLWLRVVHGWNPRVESTTRQSTDSGLASIIKSSLKKHEVIT